MDKKITATLTKSDWFYIRRVLQERADNNSRLAYIPLNIIKVIDRATEFDKYCENNEVEWRG